MPKNRYKVVVMVPTLYEVETTDEQQAVAVANERARKQYGTIGLSEDDGTTFRPFTVDILRLPPR